MTAWRFWCSKIGAVCECRECWLWRWRSNNTRHQATSTSDTLQQRKASVGSEMPVLKQELGSWLMIHFATSTVGRCPVLCAVCEVARDCVLSMWHTAPW